MANQESSVVIDEIGLVLLLVNMYGERIVDVDWNTHRGDIFMFEDNPVVRTCIALWYQSYRENDTLLPIERYLYSLIDYETRDMFLTQEVLADEIKSHQKQMKEKYGLDETR